MPKKKLQGLLWTKVPDPGDPKRPDPDPQHFW